MQEIIVTFAEEGFVVLDLSNTGKLIASLYLVTGAVEGTARFKHPGEHPAAWSMVIASTVLAAAQGSFPVIPIAFPGAPEIVAQGLKFNDLQMDGGIAVAVNLLTAQYIIGHYEIPYSSGASLADGGYWRILDHFSSITTDRLAEQIVKEGLASIGSVPRITFGKLTSIDRSEIESFMNIRNLIAEYAKDSEIRPLSIAVFGTPGSGKSFGVVQIAENILPDQVVKIEFNVSQFSKRGDLATALHKVRDVALGGKLPLIFFDEFDSDIDGQKLGWLKSFLMPMQDGKFFEGEAEHPIGKCIFVFAGGTCSSFDQFSAPLNLAESSEERRLFKALKVPDFISRLRGTINVLGPNRKDDNDKSFLLRRALLLRSLCDRKLKDCFVKSKLNIDESILTAMLLVPKYLHGARSMECIIDMSRTAGRSKWEPASLPVHAQLALHVDADAFIRLLLRDVLLGSYREQLAQQIHENYQKIQQEKKITDSAITSQGWEQLTKEYKESNRSQADDIINKLGPFGYGFDAGDSFFETVKEFPRDKLEEMANTEHKRWMDQKLAAGWTYAPDQKDELKKTSPYLLEWEKLDHATQELDRDAVRNIIPLFEQIGMRVYKRD